jgi:tRNA threonylcarbamoyladenosine biosynthesis protein TsaE
MEEEIFQYISNDEEETILLGEKIGELLEPGQIILLSGELGAGKTILVQGICNGLGVDEDVTSPTYTLINEYEGELTVYHMDLYRLEDEEDLYDVGVEDYLDTEGIVLIEWPDLVYDLLPPDFVYIRLVVLDDNTRKITIEAEGDKGIRLIERLAENVGNGY